MLYIIGLNIYYHNPVFLSGLRFEKQIYWVINDMSFQLELFFLISSSIEQNYLKEKESSQVIKFRLKPLRLKDNSLLTTSLLYSLSVNRFKKTQSVICFTHDRIMLGEPLPNNVCLQKNQSKFKNINAKQCHQNARARLFQSPLRRLSALSAACRNASASLRL